MAGSIARGERLKDRYRLERLLGRGGMAAVWLGFDERLERQVAVKLLADTIASDPGFVVRFRREARTAAGLSHPNLVRVFDFSDEGERPYLVMEYLPGEDLASRLAREAPVDAEQLALELLDALAHIHEVGILHRDVKPANIVVEPGGTAKLIDFGIALPPDATSLTRTGLVLGTERYTAPEVMEGRPATERSDLYSCGMVLRQCGGERSRGLAILIGSLTAADPGERPLSAEHALAQLERAADRDASVEQPTQVFEPTAAEPPRPEPTEPLPRSASPSSPARKGRGLAIAAVLGVVAIVAAVAAFALSGGDDSGSERQQARAVGGNAQDIPAAGTSEPSAEPTTPATEEEEPEPEPEPDPEPADSGTGGLGAAGNDPAIGAALNEQGYALIGTGDYAAAVPVLEESVAAFPAGSDDVNYAYALFNLANALRLSGRAAEAIPLLEQRLAFPDQRAAVREELRTARAEAG